MISNDPYDPRQDLADLEVDVRRILRAAYAVVRNARRSGDLLTDSLMLDLRDAADELDAWLKD